MAIAAPLAQLLATPGPTGQEGAAARVWRDWCATFVQDVGVDSSGSSWARVPGTAVPGAAPAGAAPSLAVVGHIDEIGVHITHIDDEGFLRFGALGDWDPVNLVGQRVVLATKDGPLRAVIGRKPVHLMSEEDAKRPVEIKDLHLDIGAADADQARDLVRIGDAGVLDVAPLEFPGGRIVSRSLDNRVGCYVAARAAELVVQAGGARGELLALAVVQEEIGYRGARTSAYRHRPDLAIAVDVTFASDTPGAELGQDTHHKLGSGPVLARGPMVHPRMFELLHDTAQAHSIPFTVESIGESSGTDAEAIYVSRAGIPTAIVSVPLRYMHSAVEMVDVADVENAARLIAAFASRLEPGESFER